MGRVMSNFSNFLLIISLLSSLVLSQRLSLQNVPKDITVFLKNERIFDQYMNCIFERGPCTREGHRLREILPDFFERNCSDCSEREQELANQALTYIRDNKPDVWDKLMDKYNPPKRPRSFLQTLFGF